mgnify:CR=1 FL=1
MGQEGIRSNPGQQAPHVATQVYERRFRRTGVKRRAASLFEPGYRMLHQIGILLLLPKHLAHFLQDLGVQIPGHCPK